MKAHNVLKLGECVKEAGRIHEMCEGILDDNNPGSASHIVCVEVGKLRDSLDKLLQEVIKSE